MVVFGCGVRVITLDCMFFSSAGVEFLALATTGDDFSNVCENELKLVMENVILVYTRICHLLCWHFHWMCFS